MKKISRYILAWLLCVAMFFESGYSTVLAAEASTEVGAIAAAEWKETTGAGVEDTSAPESVFVSESEEGNGSAEDTESDDLESSDPSEEDADSKETIENDGDDSENTGAPDAGDEGIDDGSAKVGDGVDDTDADETGVEDEDVSEEDAEEVVDEDVTDEEELLDEKSDSLSDKLLTDEEIEELLTKAKEAFDELVDRKDLMALIYLTDAYDVKAEPDSDSASVITLSSGHTVYVQDVCIDEETLNLWYETSFYYEGTEYSGYVEDSFLAYADEEWIHWKENYILNLPEKIYGKTMQSFNALAVPSDADIAAFPGGYWGPLQELRAKYPKWKFVAMNTGLDFNTAVKNEKGDKSWIEKSASSEFVGASIKPNWAYATEKGIAYFMNPVNFLSAERIFQFEQLTFNSTYHKKSGIQSFLNSTFMSGDIPGDSKGRTYAEAFYTIGKGEQVSPIHLASRVRQEQRGETSPLISGTYSRYKGYYNYFNVGASGKTDAEVIENGLKYAKSQGWNTRYKSLAGGAKTIGTNYIRKGQDTPYLQKFNVNKDAANALYTHQYMQNIRAPYAEAKTTYDMYESSGSLSSAFVFKIPVFKNQPGSVFNALESISLDRTNVILRRSDTVESEMPLAADEVAAASLQLNVDYLFEDPGEEDTSEDLHIAWKSSNTAVVKVSSTGKITAVGAGTAKITATADKAVAAVKPKATCTVTVSAPITELAIKDNIHAVVENPEFTIYAGQTLNLAGQYTPGDTTTPKNVTWTSSKPAVAEVSGGRVSAKTVGTATISLQVAGYPVIAKCTVAKCTVHVIACRVAFMDVDGETECAAIDNLWYGATLGNGHFPDMSAAAEENHMRFLGWYTKPNGEGTAFTENTKITEENIVLFPYMVDSDRAFYIVPVGDKIYTGSSIKPKVQVYDTAKMSEENELVPLTEGKDYTVTYKNNKAVNKEGKPVPTIIVKGKGNYSGTKKIYFNILPMSLSDTDIKVKDITVKYTGKVIKSLPVVKRGTKTLKKDTDYKVSYPETYAGAYKKAGVYPIRITGKGGYKGSITIYETITTDAVPGRVSITKAVMTGFSSKTYTGNIEDVKQNIELTYNGAALVCSEDGETGDYTVSYKKITSAGTAAMTITGINGFKGTLSKTYKIKAASLETLASDGKLVYIYDTEVPYTKKKTTPAVSVTYFRDGQEIVLKKGTDYTVTYKYNTAVTTETTPENKKPYLVITGKGNFKGTLTGGFSITHGEFTNVEKVKISASDVVFSKKKGFYKNTKVALKDSNGYALKAGTDYDTAFTYTYVGTPQVVDLQGNEIEREDGELVGTSDIPLPGTVIRVAVKAKKYYLDPTSEEDAEEMPNIRIAEYRIISQNISKASVKKITKTYASGKPILLTEEDLIVTLDGVPLTLGVDYVIDESSYKNNVKYGTASVVIRGINTVDEEGNVLYYGGSKTVKYTIKRKGFLW